MRRKKFGFRSVVSMTNVFEVQCYDLTHLSGQFWCDHLTTLKFIYQNPLRFKPLSMIKTNSTNNSPYLHKNETTKEYNPSAK